MAGKYKYLTLEDRRLIANMLNDCRPAAMIAHTLGVSAETVYRELKRGVPEHTRPFPDTVFLPYMGFL